MPRGSRGPKPKWGTREYFVVVRGLPPTPMTEKPPKGIGFAAAKDFAYALAQQYGIAGMYTTETVSRKKREGGHRENYKWPDWRWRLIRNFKADWFEAQLQYAPNAPDKFGRPVPLLAPQPVAVNHPTFAASSRPAPGYRPRQLPVKKPKA